MSFGVTKKLFFAILLLSFIPMGCSKKATNTNLTSTDGLDTSLPVDDGSSYSTSNLPGNLFDPSTTSDGTPTSTSTTDGTVTTQDQYCLSQDSGLFGMNLSQWGSTSSTFPWYGNNPNSCYSSNSSMNINTFMNTGLSGLNLMDACLRQVLAAKPTSTDQTQVKSAFVLASMAIIRCGIQYLSMQQPVVPWYAPQREKFKRNKNILLIYLKDQSAYFGN